MIAPGGFPSREPVRILGVLSIEVVATGQIRP